MPPKYRVIALWLLASILLAGCGLVARPAVTPTSITLITPVVPTFAVTSPPVVASPTPASIPATPTDAPVAPASDMTWTLIANAEKRGAVCNDGSPAGYYFRRGVGAGSHVWEIHLQGGGACVDAVTCGARGQNKPEFMSASDLPAVRAGNGIQSTSPADNPDFYNANHVFIHYCSSDFWSGDREASAETDGRHFRGLWIVRSAIEDLMDASLTPAPNLADATLVVLSGSSAGGAGVLVHLDWLAAQLPGVVVRGVNDAGWFLDSQPYDTALRSPAASLSIAYRLWQSTVDESCAAAHPGDESQCFIGPEVYPYLTTPVFIQIAQFDAPQLGQLGLTQPLDKTEAAYAVQFGEAVRASLEPVTAAFSPARKTHGLLADAEYWKIRIQKQNLRDVLTNWLFDRSGPVKLIAPFNGELP